jgi:hypothetical protein
MKLSRTIKMIGYVDEADAIKYIAERYGITLTKTQLKNLALKHMPLNSSFWQDMIRNDVVCTDEERGGGEVSIDTATGEDIVNALCQKLMKVDWPTYGDHQNLSKKEQQKFWDAFRYKLVVNQYELDGDWVKNRMGF